jgi:hypothetical protein
MLMLTFTFCFNPESRKAHLITQIQTNEYFSFVKEKALEVATSGFNVSDINGKVSIRDYNTFIELLVEVAEVEMLRETLLVFLRLQGESGNIIASYIPVENVQEGNDYTFSKLEPRYAGFSNSVETDQELSLIQAVYKYIQVTGDIAFLNDLVGGKRVGERLELALSYLMNHRFNHDYGLLWGATYSSQYAFDIYYNAMFLIALDNFMEMLPARKNNWQSIYEQVAQNSRKYLWDEANQKFKPHIYMDGSPFPDDFNEYEIYYHGCTAIAIEAGLLSKSEISISLKKMVENVKASGAASIGLTLYPPYPEGIITNSIMYPYGYQNGGDWTWFGGRMIQQLIIHGFVEEAYEHIQPMVKRVKENDGFYEWYTIHNEPRGSGTFHGSAGVLFKAIQLFDNYANSNL